MQTLGRYSGYPWNRGEGNADGITMGTTIVDSGNIDDNKYTIRTPFYRNRIVNIKITNTSNSKLEVVPSQISSNKDVVAGFKQYDESSKDVDQLKIFGFIQYNESDKNMSEKREPFPPTDYGYSLTPVKYLKLKTKGTTLPAAEVPGYDYEAYELDTTTYKNSEVKKTTERKNLLTISGLDLMALLSQLRAENRNYSLQILV